VDLQFLETAGKYGGLAGIALIVLLWIVRAVLKLQIFAKIRSRETYLTITLIIKCVSLITVVAIICWAVVALFSHGAEHPTNAAGAPVTPTPTAAPPRPLVVTNLPYDTGDMPSGQCADYSPWYKLCSDNQPANWAIVSHHFTLSGNRSCTSGWAECKKTVDTAAKVCYEFRMQGQSQECGHSGNTGIHNSQGHLDVSWQHPE